MNGWETALTIAGLAVITLLSRGFFVLTDREIPIPAWLQQGLRHAPLAALVAVVVPEIVLTQGQFTGTWQDPRLFATAAGAAWWFWRRGILGTIVCGTAVMATLRLGLGW